jgi:hypothetical protein
LVQAPTFPFRTWQLLHPSNHDEHPSGIKGGPPCTVVAELVLHGGGAMDMHTTFPSLVHWQRSVV